MRITRSSKEANVIPHVRHFIEVLSKIREKERNAENRREVWWRAKVNSLELIDRLDVIAVGIITYCKTLDDFEPEAAQVEFFAGRNLRETARSRVKGRRDQNGNGRFPQLSWRTDAMKQNTMVEDSDGFTQRSSITSTSTFKKKRDGCRSKGLQPGLRSTQAVLLRRQRRSQVEPPNLGPRLVFPSSSVLSRKRWRTPLESPPKRPSALTSERRCHGDRRRRDGLERRERNGE